MTSVYTQALARSVALFATAMLLLCQTTAAALTYLAPQSKSQVTTVNGQSEAPCHLDNAAGGDSVPAQGCHDRCPVRDATPDTAKISIPAAHALLLPVIALMPPLARVATAAPRSDFTATATPPPLRLAYCRLLN